MRRVLVLLAVGLMLLACSPWTFAQEMWSGEIIVKSRVPGFPVVEGPVQVVRFSNSARRRTTQSSEVWNAVATYKAFPWVAYAEPNYVVRADQTNDPQFTNGNQWALRKIQAPQAWNLNKGDANIRVAVLDSGIDGSHPELNAKVVMGYDFVENDATPQDANGHGTHVAGIIAAETNNMTGVASLGWNTTLMIGRVLDANGNGSHAAIANAIYWATDNGAKVINLSLGGSTGSQTLSDAVHYAATHDVVIVASAGNNGNTAANYPAYYGSTIAVAATDPSDRRASYSTYGLWVDMAAPGSQILSTLPGGYGYASGTSMAAPMVSAAAALVWNTSYGTSANAIRIRLVATGVPVRAGFGSYPVRRLNAYRAIAGSTSLP